MYQRGKRTIAEVWGEKNEGGQDLIVLDIELEDVGGFLYTLPLQMLRFRPAV